MSEKPTNGAGEPAEDRLDEAPPAAAELDGDEEEFPVEVEAEDSGAAAADPDAADDAADAGLDNDDWAEIVGSLTGEKTELEAKLAELEGEKRDFYERMLRAVADADNARKRARKDVEEARIESRSRALREILPVIDNLERAVQHAEQTQGHDPEASGVIEGVRLVLRQFAQALERCDAHPVEAQGKPFDPNVHEAISQQETDEVAPGTVVQVLQRGYKIGERLLRPSLVVVAGAPKQAAPPAEAEDVPEAVTDESEPASGEED